MKPIDARPMSYEPHTRWVSRPGGKACDNVRIEITMGHDGKVIPITVDTKRNARKLLKLFESHCAIAGRVRVRDEAHRGEE